LTCDSTRLADVFGVVVQNGQSEQPDPQQKGSIAGRIAGWIHVPESESGCPVTPGGETELSGAGLDAGARFSVSPSIAQ
jgi:hypothetical protein